MGAANRNPRLLIVGKAYAPHIGGVEAVMQQVAEGMRKWARVSVLTCRDTMGAAEKDCINGVKVYRCGSLGTFRSCPVSMSFLSAFRRKVMVADVVELHLPFPLADLACILSGYRGKVVVAWHSDIVRQRILRVAYQPMMHALLRRADVIITATQAYIDLNPTLQPYREKCAVVPYGIDTKLYDDTPYQPVLQRHLRVPHAKKILFVGRLVYYKGADVLLKAFAMLPQSPACELFLIGEGEEKAALQLLAHRLAIADSVHFLGRRMEPELRAAFKDCDLFVLPSTANSEAFGLVQLEAMACSKPVINTALPTGVPQVSLHGETGLTVPAGDAEALCNAMALLLGDASLCKRYGKAAKDRVKQAFALQTVLERRKSVLLDDLPPRAFGKES
ncbi:MAG: glycosyltransferase [Oscillospiraceae bacterium]